MPDRAASARLSQRHSRNLEHLKKVQLNGGPATSHAHHRNNGDIFASLRATQLLGQQSKSALPAELIATILDYLPPADLARCARVSHMLQEMVYDDSRWVQKLKAMDAWNEVEARQRFEEAMKRKTEALKGVGGNAGGTSGGARPMSGNVTLFDAGLEEKRDNRKSLDAAAQAQQQRRRGLAEGFDEQPATTTSSLTTNRISSSHSKSSDANSSLTVFDRVRSVRGHARSEFGKVYAALGPLYYDLTSAASHAEARLFRTYHNPEQQAQMLANLNRFGGCDTTSGAIERGEKLEELCGVFENAVLQEFSQGYAAGDVEGRMRRYAHVLVTLNGGAAGREAFIASNPIIARTMRVGQPLECLESVAPGHVDLNPSQIFFERLAAMLVKQATIIDQVFPPSIDVLTPFLERLCDEVISDFLTTLFDVAHDRGSETYVKAVAGTFSQALRLVATLTPTKASPSDFAEQAKHAVVRCFEKHIDLYLKEEYDLFGTKSTAAVSDWEREQSEQEASTESFYMSNIQRQAAKRDFLSSFKKVVMMPVNALPLASPFASAKPASVVARSSVVAIDASVDTSYTGAGTPPFRPGTPMQERPTTELAAKTAIMNSRLEGIKSLFSIEIALNLTHLAKASIERAALMVQMGGDAGSAAKEQCAVIFVKLLDVLGNRHVRNGFDKAVGHLSSYRPREVRRQQNKTGDDSTTSNSEHGNQVEPLVTFLELVNVGDLIQQMIDVFYAQELVATKLTDRDDFLDPAVKEKRKFEHMLDERVAAGLNKGIDVLMDEVEFICATNQAPADFNPEEEGVSSSNKAAKNRNSVMSTTSASNNGVIDIGPSTTAQQVVSVVSAHTSMLTGSTDKNTLDVFLQEVGLRLFGVLCKHLKRQRISVQGAVRLICDLNHYSAFIATLRQKPLLPYYQALREMAGIYLVYVRPPGAYFGGSSASSNSGSRPGSMSGPSGAAKGHTKRLSILGGKSNASPTTQQAKELATIIADTQRYHGIFPAEEVYEFAERRADWYLVKGEVERAMYGVGCSVM